MLLLRHCLAIAVLLASASRTWAVNSVNIRVNASANDAEQNSGGTVNLTSQLNMAAQPWVGMRFTNVTVPQGAYIVSAYVTFTANANDASAANLTLFAEDVDNSAAFTTAANNISTRAQTSASVTWNPVASWSNNVSYNSPDLQDIVQEVVTRSGWASGNSMSILVRSNNTSYTRRAKAYDTSTTLCPLLHIDYVVIPTPVATRLLFIVNNTGSLTAQESFRQYIFQLLGYTVTLINASATQASYDTAAAVNDVAFISEEVVPANLNTKLKGKSLGVVNESIGLVDDFALASTAANPSGTSVTITKTNHFITSAFPLGAFTLTTSSQSLNTYSGTLATDIDVLGTIGGANALMVVEGGGMLNDGTKAAGRRVQLPWGGSTFDMNAMQIDAYVLMARALAWAGGVTGHWKLDEASGTTAADSTSTAKTGTLTNLSFTNDRIANARVDGGLLFDGTADYISVPNSTTVQLTKAMSMSAWIKGSSWGSGSAANVIVRKGDDNPNNYQFAIENGYLALGLDGSDGSNARGNTPLNTNQWYHVVATWDGTTIRFYLNGVADGTTARSGTVLTDTRPFYIGGRAGSDYFHGALDDVRFFNYALDTDEITVLKTQGAVSGVQILKWVEIQ